MKAPKAALRHRLRPLLLAGIVIFVIAEIVALSPSSLEQPNPDHAVPAAELMDEGQNQEFLASGIPRDHVPEYTVKRFNYISTEGNRKLWKLIANRAFLYSHEKLVHGRAITAFLYDPDGKSTVITGKEAKYLMGKKDLEIYGDVKTVFPDGFEIHSPYLLYRPGDRVVEVPVQDPVDGTGLESNGSDKISFKSHGLHFKMDMGEIILPSQVEVMVSKPPVGPRPADETRILSDHCRIERHEQIAYFSMNAARPVDSRFVRIHQPTLFAKSRTAELRYGDFSKLLNYLTLHEDVLVRELGKSSQRYGTGGRADFDSERNVIVLREFPQVYQDKDTVTGDVITVHRDTDIVEVEHSNAFSEGDTRKQQ